MVIVRCAAYLPRVAQTRIMPGVAYLEISVVPGIKTIRIIRTIARLILLHSHHLRLILRVGLIRRLLPPPRFRNVAAVLE